MLKMLIALRQQSIAYFSLHKPRKKEDIYSTSWTFNYSLSCISSLILYIHLLNNLFFLIANYTTGSKSLLRLNLWHFRSELKKLWRNFLKIKKNIVEWENKIEQWELSISWSNKSFFQAIQINVIQFFLFSEKIFTICFIFFLSQKNRSSKLKI